jgi:hypothetical protein
MPTKYSIKIFIKLSRITVSAYRTFTHVAPPTAAEPVGDFFLVGVNPLKALAWS